MKQKTHGAEPRESFKEDVQTRINRHHVGQRHLNKYNYPVDERRVEQKLQKPHKTTQHPI